MGKVLQIAKWEEKSSVKYKIINVRGICDQ